VGKNSGNTFYGTEISFKTPEVEMPEVETFSVKDVGTNRATCVGRVVYDGGADITEKGICWSTSPNPTIEDNHLASDGDNGNIEVNITGLSNFTTYYVRAYANNGTHIGYSDAVKITTNGFIAGRDKEEVETQAVELLRGLDLSERALHKPAQMSGGEQQRVAVARALINQPAVLLADEPSGNLDTHNRRELHRLFFDLRERTGQTVVIVTHDEELAYSTDRTLRLVDGLLVNE
jgi:lipoprotein-releasing system ATP-binding protein